MLLHFRFFCVIFYVNYTQQSRFYYEINVFKGKIFQWILMTF